MNKKQNVLLSTQKASFNIQDEQALDDNVLDEKETTTYASSTEVMNEIKNVNPKKATRFELTPREVLRQLKKLFVKLIRLINVVFNIHYVTNLEKVAEIVIVPKPSTKSLILGNYSGWDKCRQFPQKWLAQRAELGS